MRLTLQQMSGGDARAWLRSKEGVFLSDWTDAGIPEDRARANLENACELVDPSSGADSPQKVFRVLDDGEEVGGLWFGPDSSGDSAAWWVWYVEVNRELRGRGLGRAAMQEAECIAGDYGATKIGLNVMGSNHTARSLYESLGYRPVSISMTKALGE
ncbi:GNAT family N-acetyltransferase [Corynebacterium variabile]|uniref:GNAT family N-acetyltransferase n=1 Tax=Corynebacterium variabile TaxID=1727 RepID=UPI003BB14F36